MAHILEPVGEYVKEMAPAQELKQAEEVLIS